MSATPQPARRHHRHRRRPLSHRNHPPGANPFTPCHPPLWAFTSRPAVVSFGNHTPNLTPPSVLSKKESPHVRSQSRHVLPSPAVVAPLSRTACGRPSLSHAPVPAGTYGFFSANPKIVQTAWRSVYTTPLLRSQHMSQSSSTVQSPSPRVPLLELVNLVFTWSTRSIPPLMLSLVDVSKC